MHATEPCVCCYCGSTQKVKTPPGLHTCSKCGHDFRTVRSGATPIELAVDAKRFYNGEEQEKR